MCRAVSRLARGCRRCRRRGRRCGSCVALGWSASGCRRTAHRDEEHKVELLTQGRLVVATARGIEALSAAHCTPAGSLDLNQTLKMIEAERDRLQGIYDALPSARKKTLVAPRWPATPRAIPKCNAPSRNATYNYYCRLQISVAYPKSLNCAIAPLHQVCHASLCSRDGAGTGLTERQTAVPHVRLLITACRTRAV
jgi:hypothetical protein